MKGRCKKKKLRGQRRGGGGGGIIPMRDLTGHEAKTCIMKINDQ
jgi:hypothetical protein